MTDESTNDHKGRFDASRLITLGRVTAIAPSPCGTWLAAAVERLDEDKGAEYVSDLWRVPLDGGEPTRLTRGKSKDSAPCFRRDGALGFLSNRPTGEGKAEEGDDKRMQVWILPAQGGEPTPVTDEPLGIGAFRFAAEAGVLACLAPVLPDVPHDKQRETAQDRKKHGPSALRYRESPVRYWDHWLPEAAPHLTTYDDQGGGRRDWTPEADRELRDAVLDVSPDGTRGADTWQRISEIDRCPDGLVWVFDLETGERREIGDGPQTGLTPVVFSPDGKRLAAAHHRRHPERAWRTTLRLFDLETGDSSPLAETWDVWPTPEAWTPDGRALLVTADRGGRVPVYRVDVASGQVARLTTEAAGGSYTSVRPVAGGERLVGIRSTLLHPPEPFVMALEPASQPTVLGPLSGFLAQEGAQVATIEDIEVTSSDGAPVQCFIVKPADHGVDDPPLPTVLWIHGGPMGAWGDGWHWRWNPLVPVAAGYAIALPNPRGSTGFGQPFIDGIWGNVWGGQCYDDVMAVADALEDRPDIDAERTAAMGGSFGGYMANWLGGNTDRFRCLITHAGLFSMSTHYGDTDLPAFWAFYMGEYPYENPDSFDRYSPSKRVKNWTTPTLIIHGEKDYRVPISQALFMFEALQYHGVDSELLVFPNENHWILKPRNIIAWYQRVLDYLERHLGGERETASEE